MANKSHPHIVKVYLNDDELTILNAKCTASGMNSRTAFLRQMILYGCVFDINYEHLREYNTTLSRIGNSLNQIAKRLNTTGHAYDEDIKEVKELMEQVWQSQKSMVSSQPYTKQ